MVIKKELQLSLPAGAGPGEAISRVSEEEKGGEGTVFRSTLRGLNKIHP